MVLAGKKQAVVIKPRGRGAQKQAGGRGTIKMNAAANKTLEEKCRMIADALADKAISGNVNCAKLLYALAEGQIDFEDEGSMNRLSSMAEELASEVEWKDETPETDAETS
jgi:hypothetical protein